MKPTIEYSTFDQLDFRVGKVLEAHNPDWSPKLVELKVDFGPEIGERTILTGIRQWHGPESIQGKSYIFVANMAERKMGPGVSQGMMIMADGEAPILIPVPDEIVPGTVVR